MLSGSKDRNACHNKNTDIQKDVIEALRFTETVQEALC